MFSLVPRCQGLWGSQKYTFNPVFTRRARSERRLRLPITVSFPTVLRQWVEFTQYTAIEFGKRCKAMGVRPSMGSVGDAYDNAMAESFFPSLECELIERNIVQSKAEAPLALFSYIEGWYNPRRRHSALGYRSPLAFERAHQPALTTAIVNTRT